jgi:hypothetical protein
MQVDASEVVGRRPGTGGRSAGNVPLGASFSAERFRALVADVLGGAAFGKDVSVDVAAVGASEVAVSMAVSRGFRLDGLHLVLDADTLLRDLVLSDPQYRVHSDASFMLHVPLFLFSFADDARLVHFGGGEAVRAKAIGGLAVVIVENRLRSKPGQHQDVTALAVREVLELLCGLRPEQLDLVDMARTSLPPLIKDIARRNVLQAQLSWSLSTAVAPADAVVNTDGYARGGGGGGDSALAQSRRATQILLARTLAAWDKAAATLDGREIEDTSLRLATSVQELRERVSDDLCSRSWTGEVELEVAIAERPGRGRLGALRSRWRTVVLPALLGALTAGASSAFARRRPRWRTPPPRSPLPSGVVGADVAESTTTQWFSTLVQRPDRSRTIKLN